jgi:hypothetical protein
MEEEAYGNIALPKNSAILSRDQWPQSDQGLLDAAPLKPKL